MSSDSSTFQAICLSIIIAFESIQKLLKIYLFQIKEINNAFGLLTGHFANHSFIDISVIINIEIKDIHIVLFFLCKTLIPFFLICMDILWILSV